MLSGQFLLNDPKNISWKFQGSQNVGEDRYLNSIFRAHDKSLLEQ